MLTTTLRVSGALHWLAAGLLVVGCGGDGGGGDGIDAGTQPGELPTYSVAGALTDFHTGEALAGGATQDIDGLLPKPQFTINGNQFSFAGVPPSSVFHIQVSGDGYRPTFNRAIDLVESNVTGVVLEAVGETYIETLATAFGVSPGANTGILLVRVVDDQGIPLAGVPASAFQVNELAPSMGPYFLNPTRDPAVNRTETSDSGFAVFFDVAPGPTAVSAAPGSNISMSMIVSPVASGGVTIADVTTKQDGAVEVPLPQNVSFVNQIIPIFERRNCTGCHAGGGAGRQDGGLALQSNPDRQYEEITVELSPRYNTKRVNLEDPASSLILTMPGFVRDIHPNTTFATATDPDYLLLLVWITEGALNN